MKQIAKVYIQGVQKVGPFTNRETGEIIEGTNVYYVTENQEIENAAGFIPAKKWLKPEEQIQIKQVPAWYDMEVELVLTGNKPKVNFKGFHFKETGKSPFDK